MAMLINKYSLWYDQLVVRAQFRIKVDGEYYEKHHIIPRSLGGSNQKNNLCHLTAREHFICHWLLTKFTMGEAYHKMIHAWHKMAYCNSLKQNRYKPTSVEYEILRKKRHRAMIGRALSESTRKKISLSNKGRSVVNKGVPMSEEQKKKMSEAKKGSSGLKGESNPMFGKIPWNKGVPQTETAKQKQRDYATGRTVTESTKQKMAKSAKESWRKRRNE